MRPLLLLAVIAAACGGPGGNRCDMSVSEVSAEVNGHFTLSGSFADAQPIMQLTDTAGNMYAIPCDGNGDTADCDTADALGLHAGMYKLAFSESCLNAGESPGIPTLADSLPTMVTVN